MPNRGRSGMLFCRKPAMNFEATSVEYWSDEGTETVFLGNEEKELALTISGPADATGHYLEWNDQANGCSGAVKSVRLSGRKLQIELLAKAAKKIGEAKFGIAIDCDEAVLEEVTNRLQAIFGGKLELKKAAGGATHAKRASEKPPADYSKIKYLNLERKNLKALPGHIAELTALEVAHLARNPRLDFQAVCEALSTLPKLKELTFTTNGPVPENIGKLTQLESLRLDGFTVPAVLPESFGRLGKLNSLLIMSDSDVVLPESFAELSELQSLNIRAKSWQAPSQIHKLTKLTSLDLGNCRFPRVPEGMAGMAAVTTVFLGGQDAASQSQLLPIVARMPNVRTLQLSTRAIPPEIELVQQIRELVVWGARHVPAAIGKLKRLETLVLTLGDFESLPESIGELSHLKLLNVSENPSFHVLPESLGNLSQLTHLILHENPRLTRLPESAAKLTGLETFRIEDPGRVSGIPAAWQKLIT